MASVLRGLLTHFRLQEMKRQVVCYTDKNFFSFLSAYSNVDEYHLKCIGILILKDVEVLCQCVNQVTEGKYEQPETVWPKPTTLITLFPALHFFFLSPSPSCATMIVCCCCCCCCFWIFFLFFFNFYFYFILLYNTILVLPYIDMNPPRVYMSSQS